MMPRTPVFKVLILAGSALSPLVSAKIVHTVSALFARLAEASLSGQPLPTFTDAFLIKFAGTNLSLALALSVSVMILISVVTVANPKRPANESTQTLQLLLAFAGPMLSLIYLGMALIAATLPAAIALGPAAR